MADKKVTVLARFKAKKGKEEQLKQTIMACVAPTRADLDIHLETPYLTELKAKAGELCAEPIEITLWEMISTPA